MMAFTRADVRAESFLATSSGSRFSVSGETSAKIGVAPWYKMQLAVAQKVMGVVIASSPGPSPAAKAAPCNAAVPELKLTACLAPIQAANRSSNSPTFGPVVSQSVFRTSTTAWTSASSRLCRPYGNSFSRTGVPPWMASVSSLVGKALMSGRRRNRLGSAGFRRHELLQFPPRQPALVGIARITEAFGKRLTIHPVFRLPPRMRRLNHIHIFCLKRLPRLVFRDQHLVQLLSRTNPDVLHLAAGSNGLGQVQQSHAGNLGDKNLAAVHLFQAADHKLHALFQRQPESSHARIGNRDLPASPLLQKHRNHAAAAAYDVPIARAAEARIFRTRISVRLHKHFLRAQLGGAIQIDGIHRLVGAERQDAAHALIKRRINYVTAAHDICLDRFERVVFASRHLFEGRCVDDHRHARERPLQALHVPNVSDEITQAGMIEAGRPHLMLLQLVAAENYQSVRLVIAQHDLHKLLPERPGSARHQYRFLRPIHHSYSSKSSFCRIRRRDAVRLALVPESRRIFTFSGSCAQQYS